MGIMGEIVFYVFLLVLCGVGLYYLIDDVDAALSSVVTAWACCLLLLIILTAIEFTPKERPVSKYTIKKEVRKVEVNGTIVKTDTVYIFTKKKD